MLLLALTVTSVAQADANLSSRIDRLLASPALVHGTQGVIVQSLSTGRVLYERNADLALVPASNFKLLVSAAALDRFGPEHRLLTRVCFTGNVGSNGALSGDIVLVGGGDPLLSRADLLELARAVAAKGVRSVTGAVVGDDTLFDDVRLGLGWAWSDEPYYYSAEISALCLDGNAVDVYVSPGAGAGESARVRIDPPTSFVRVENTAVTALSGEDSISVSRVHGRNVIRVTGNVPVGLQVKGPIERISVVDPALYAATEFRSALEASGVKVAGRTFTRKLSLGSTPAAEHLSPPLSVILSKLLKPSDNLIAEVLFKSLGAATSGVGTAETAQAAEIEFIKRSGMDPGAVSIADGSGLSRRDYTTPQNLVLLLKYMWGHKNGRVFIDALPIAGVDGTLRNRMKGTAAAGNVRAKTGYVSRVSCLSGYVTTKSGDPLAFSIMMNGHLCPNSDATRVQDAICEALAGYNAELLPQTR